MLSTFTTYSQETILNVKFNKVKQSGATPQIAKLVMDTANQKKSPIDSLTKKGKSQINGTTVILSKEIQQPDTIPATVKSNKNRKSILNSGQQEKKKLAVIVAPEIINPTDTPIVIDPPIVEKCKLDTVTNIVFKKQGDNFYTGTLLDSNGNPLQTFNIKQLNKALFYDNYRTAMLRICDDDAAGIDTIIAHYGRDKRDLYTQFLEAKEDLANTDGLAGTLTIHKQVVMYNSDEKNKNHSNNSDTAKQINTITGTNKPFTVYNIQIQFQDGFIENIKVFGKIAGDSNLLKYENFFPIGFSTKKDFRRLMDFPLYESSNAQYYNKSYLLLGNLISFNQELINNSKDYCPANQVLKITDLTKDNTQVFLYKEQTSKILEAKIFSDLKGTDINYPNGLIQVELSKKLNFLTKRYPISKKKVYISNCGVFNYVTPEFSINKVEDNHKRLVVTHINNLSLAADTSKPVVFASTIDLLRHQVYKVGFDLSIFLLDFHHLKSTLEIGMGTHFGRTAIQDTTRIKTYIDASSFEFKAASANNVKEYGINTFQYGPYLTWQIFPSGRFGVSATQRFTWVRSLTDSFNRFKDNEQFLKTIAQTSPKEKGTIPFNFSDCIASSEIYAFFNPNTDGSNKLFFRYRLNYNIKNSIDNFQQLQVGFSTYISSTKEITNLKKAAGFNL